MPKNTVGTIFESFLCFVRNKIESVLKIFIIFCMKKLLIVFFFIFLFIGISSFFVYDFFVKEDEKELQKYSQDSYETPLPEDYLSLHPELANIPRTDLSEKEQEGLILMREEEKLARDVYQTLGDRWNLQIFSNISRSEQTHTDAIAYLLEKYEIEDPVQEDTIGIFADPELQKLYESLVVQGSKSLVDALKVGALIEDLDIFDIQRLSQETDSEDILLVYANLDRGSRNHMRAFTRQIERQGETYIPQYISQSEYLEIISSERESGEGMNQKGMGRG